MLSPKLVEGLTEQLNELAQGSRGLPGQELVKQQVETLIKGAVERLELVSREDFEAQKSVLLRTRERLEQLEKQVAELEAKLDQ